MVRISVRDENEGSENITSADAATAAVCWTPPPPSPPAWRNAFFSADVVSCWCRRAGPAEKIRGKARQGAAARQPGWSHTRPNRPLKVSRGPIGQVILLVAACRSSLYTGPWRHAECKLLSYYLAIHHVLLFFFFLSFFLFFFPFGSLILVFVWAWSPKWIKS